MKLQNVPFYQLHSSKEDFASAVKSGLRQKPFTLSPKYFYDEDGSRLFEAITETKEYYPTRTEITILRSYIEEITKLVGTGGVLLEPGGGSCSKVRILLDHLRPCAYVPMDISADHLYKAAVQTATEYSWLCVYAACVDYCQKIHLPNVIPNGRRVVFFPGSSIGNFHPNEALEFLLNMSDLVGGKGHLLIGVDLKKDRHILEAAYNDAQGLTAAFNLNVLTHINRELKADFRLTSWQHVAFYNEELGRIEMHLKSRERQQVSIEGESFEFKTGESIHTENSYKYEIEEFTALASQAGFTTQSVWTDIDQLFSVHLLQRDQG